VICHKEGSGRDNKNNLGKGKKKKMRGPVAWILKKKVETEGEEPGRVVKKIYTVGSKVEAPIVIKLLKGQFASASGRWGSLVGPSPGSKTVRNTLSESSIGSPIAEGRYLEGDLRVLHPGGRDCGAPERRRIGLSQAGVLGKLGRGKSFSRERGRVASSGSSKERNKLTKYRIVIQPSSPEGSAREDEERCRVEGKADGFLGHQRSAFE